MEGDECSLGYAEWEVSAAELCCRMVLGRLCIVQLQKVPITLYLERHKLEFKTSHDVQEKLSTGNGYMSLTDRGRAKSH